MPIIRQQGPLLSLVGGYNVDKVISKCMYIYRLALRPLISLAANLGYLFSSSSVVLWELCR